jgi:hypothetical protein
MSNSLSETATEVSELNSELNSQLELIESRVPRVIIKNGVGAPFQHSDGTALKKGDIWIWSGFYTDTSLYMYIGGSTSYLAPNGWIRIGYADANT